MTATPSGWSEMANPQCETTPGGHSTGDGTTAAAPPPPSEEMSGLVGRPMASVARKRGCRVQFTKNGVRPVDECSALINVNSAIGKKALQPENEVALEWTILSNLSTKTRTPVRPTSSGGIPKIKSMDIERHTSVGIASGRRGACEEDDGLTDLASAHPPAHPLEQVWPEEVSSYSRKSRFASQMTTCCGIMIPVDDPSAKVRIVRHDDSRSIESVDGVHQQRVIAMITLDIVANEAR
ncbi:unnamed protein product [Phytophthora fragariaefolia]|uniref:Unnamed protein product n=1 Tax=Phytophthora fragariaefolia TaxID=1490495 RepID=A0A9W6XET8_9STRA|nr:unnamed protein product [Phytophthora fragariaefolia]